MTIDSRNVSAIQQTTPSENGNDRPTLRGKMGTFSLLATALAFNAPLAILAGFIPLVVGGGNLRGAPVIFVIFTGIILLFAVGLNAMAVRMKRPGAFYAYITQGLGPKAGLAGGFVAILLYVLLGSGTYVLFAIMVKHFMQQVVGIDGGPWLLWALVGWAITTTLSLFNVDLSAKVLVIAMALEMAIVLLWNLRVFWVGGPDGNVFNPLPHFFEGSVGIAFLFASLCMTGFESLQVFREESVNPMKTVPRATYWEITIIGLLYMLCSYTFIVSVGGENAGSGAADPTGAILSSISTYVSVSMSHITSVLLITSSFAACLAIQNVASRYIYSIARNGVFPKKLAQVNKKHGSPMAASAVSGIIMLGFLLVPALAGASSQFQFEILTGVGGYSIIGIWAATSIAIIAYFWRKRHTLDYAGHWRSLIAPVLSAIGLIAIWVFGTINIADVVGGGTARGVMTFIALLLIMALGVGVASWFKKNRHEIYKSIGSQD